MNVLIGVNIFDLWSESTALLTVSQNVLAKLQNAFQLTNLSHIRT